MNNLPIETYESVVQQRDALEKKLAELGKENAYLLPSAASELNTSWMLHKTMLGAQVALFCVVNGDFQSARDWLEGTTDEAGAEIPDGMTIPELQEWFDSQMVSNDGNNGFLSHKQAEEAIKTRVPATDAFTRELMAKGVDALAVKYRNMIETMHPDTIAYGALKQEFESVIKEANKFAAQLRKGINDAQ
ncbi:hypothetical protein [Obesumbacterium proteus]|uniref:hypothetical protein n=1 Tax=Obesumbacterium proteus TaxID=82983 RepID=UPI000778A6E0|nr:hypothetical protein [Obesumbacterium proteus]AMO81076.1 hypothetical protein DSM2777_08500 [Obesumbacterium proteus]